MARDLYCLILRVDNTEQCIQKIDYGEKPRKISERPRGIESDDKFARGDVEIHF